MKIDFSNPNQLRFIFMDKKSELRERLLFVIEKLVKDGKLNRRDIVNKFNVTETSANIYIRTIRKRYPDFMEYNENIFAYQLKE